MLYSSDITIVCMSRLYIKDIFMGLYDRDYAREDLAGYGQRSETKIVSFVKETYKLFAASLMAGAVGAYVGIPMASVIQAWFIPLIILEFALLFGLFAVKRKPGINLIVMFSFVFMTGLMIAPLLSHTLALSGGASIVGNAFAMTSVIVASMSYFAIKTKADLSSYGKPLMIALFVVIGFSIVNLFLGSPMLAVLISAAVVFLFSILVVYDTQNIMNGAYETPIDGAIALYLDFLNIFTALLHLLGIFGGED